MSTRTVKPARIRTLHDSNDDDDEKKKSKRNGNPNDRGRGKGKPRGNRGANRGGRPNNPRKIDTPNLPKPLPNTKVVGGSMKLGGSNDKDILEAALERQEINLALREQKIKEREERKRLEQEALAKQEEDKLEKRRRSVEANKLKEQKKLEDQRAKARQKWTSNDDIVTSSNENFVDIEEEQIRLAIELSMITQKEEEMNQSKQTQENPIENETKSPQKNIYETLEKTKNQWPVSDSETEESETEAYVFNSDSDDEEIQLKLQKSNLKAQLMELEREQEKRLAERKKKKPIKLSESAEMNRIIREQQDRDFEEALLLDKQKELSKKQEEEAQYNQERSKKQRQADRLHKRESLGNEPDDKDEVIILVVKMPNGQKFSRKFLVNDKLQKLKDYIESLGCDIELSDTYEIRADFPRRNFHEMDGDFTLKEAGVNNRELIYVVDSVVV